MMIGNRSVLSLDVGDSPIGETPVRVIKFNLSDDEIGSRASVPMNSATARFMRLIYDTARAPGPVYVNGWRVVNIRPGTAFLLPSGFVERFKDEVEAFVAHVLERRRERDREMMVTFAPPINVMPQVKEAPQSGPPAHVRELIEVSALKRELATALLRAEVAEADANRLRGGRTERKTYLCTRPVERNRDASEERAWRLEVGNDIEHLVVVKDPQCTKPRIVEFGTMTVVTMSTGEELTVLRVEK